MPDFSASLRRQMLQGLYSLGLARAAERSFGGRGSILMMHQLYNEPFQREGYFGANEHLAISRTFFIELLDLLERLGIEIISMDEVPARLADKADDRRFAVLTFDDGYRDNFDIALPILRERKIPATIYFSSGLLDRTATMWWLSVERIIEKADKFRVPVKGQFKTLPAASIKQKRNAYCYFDYAYTRMDQEEAEQLFREACEDHDHDPYALVDELIVRWEDVAELAEDELITIGGHTIDHPVLKQCSADLVEHQVREANSQLAAAIGRSVDHFAYPYGTEYAVSKREVDIVSKLDLKTAVTTRKGMLFPEHKDNLHALPRVSINGYYQDAKLTECLLSGLPFYLLNGFKKQTTI